jgi:Transposase IS116/IS110/IS902 family
MRLDMTRFPTAGHLVSWARFAPGVTESAGKKKGKGSTGHGNPCGAAVLGNAAAAAGRTDTFPSGRYRRIARCRGAKRAIVAAGHPILVISWVAGPTAIARHRPSSGLRLSVSGIAFVCPASSNPNSDADAQDQTVALDARTLRSDGLRRSRGQARWLRLQKIVMPLMCH